MSGMPPTYSGSLAGKPRQHPASICRYAIVAPQTLGIDALCIPPTAGGTGRRLCNLSATPTFAPQSPPVTHRSPSRDGSATWIPLSEVQSGRRPVSGLRRTTKGGDHVFGVLGCR
jgi:hypothetical protein